MARYKYNPYTGEVAFTSYPLEFPSSSPNPSYLEGRVFYDATEKTLSVYTDSANITLNLGRETQLKVKNESGVTIGNGKAVCVDGYDVDSSLLLVKLCDASLADSVNLIGLATEEILNNATGYITTYGIVHDIDTSGFTEGAQVYVVAGAGGLLTETQPGTPNYIVPVGYVGKADALVGTVFVRSGTNFSAVSTKVDPQEVGSSTLSSTASLTYVDVPDMTLTTKDLGETGKYHISFASSVAASTSAVLLYFRLVIDGVEIPNTEMVLGGLSSSVAATTVVQGATTGVVAGQIIKVQYKVSAGTGYVSRRSFMFEGFPETNVAV
jgi:hypothetical protein